MPTTARSRPWFAWLCAGALVAGTFDICYAIVFSSFRSGTPPARILQSVASGALGAQAYQGGAATAALGLGFHYLNAFLITAAFFGAAARRPALVRHPMGTGLTYGAVVYGFMNYVVIPLSRIGPRPTPATVVWLSGLLVHMFLIGLPIAFAGRRWLG